MIRKAYEFLEGVAALVTVLVLMSVGRVRRVVRWYHGKPG